MINLFQDEACFIFLIILKTAEVIVLIPVFVVRSGEGAIGHFITLIRAEPNTTDELTLRQKANPTSKMRF